MSKKNIARRKEIIAKVKKQSIMKPSGFWAAFWEGLSGSGVYVTPSLNISTKKSDLEAMRGDWKKIGNDFRAGIKETQQSTR